MSTLILHHYPQSPVTEKVRIALGIKNLQWQSVEIPRIPPRPDLTPMTGGYRRTPVLQIGADIFCDSQCILRELERRYPDPSLLPAPSGEMAWGISRWIDGPVFTSAIAVVLGSAKDLPADFAADRGRLYFGENFRIENLQTEVNHHITQLNGQLHWANQMLELQHSKGHSFFSGATPGLVDVMVYYIAWFLSGRWSGGDKLLAGFPALTAWQQTMFAIGHGGVTELESAAALEIAIAARPESQKDTDKVEVPEDASGAAPGSRVEIEPDVGGGDPAVVGTVIALNANQISISRQDDIAGDVVVHFPRVGYRVTNVE